MKAFTSEVQGLTKFNIGVLGDTHGDHVSIEAALKKLGPLDALIHVGDYYRDGEALAHTLHIPVIAVVGNCDARRQPDREWIELAGKRFFVTHGHLQGVKQGTVSLMREARLHQASVVVFGHTHVPAAFSRQGILFVNPGSTHAGRKGKGRACALLVVTGTEMAVTHFSL
ncbi:MAG: Phosphodiesterase YfcE [Firmicutes bacterium]|nr:Phosphodiesterase YfcE [candidate division NPL-UPA2 bacterium]MBT9154545.1 Phosphodiesterase YfcE [candidate division NPL-UPA2 bacterium]MBT9156454.1 Phosphodiesterase YfcE [candidate division NPL-UPA2 bacterium]